MFISSGEPKHAATAMRTSAPRAAAVSATKSPMELPIAMTVRPRMEVEMPETSPIVSMIATTSLASRSSHTTVMMKPTSISSGYHLGLATGVAK